MGGGYTVKTISSDKATVEIQLTGTPTTAFEKAENISITIPASDLNADNLDASKGLVVNTLNSTIQVKNSDTPTPPEPTPDEDPVEPVVTVSEVSFVGEPRTELSGTITVNVKGATFKKDLSTAENGVKDWFVNPIDGFTYTLQSKAKVLNNEKEEVGTTAEKEDSVSIAIKGTFSDETATTLSYSVAVPPEAFNEKVKEGKKSEASGQIKETVEYKGATWKLYDSASFKNVNDASVANLNKDLTHFGDDTPLTFEDEASSRIKSGTKRLVKLHAGLSRKGYKLLGFAEKENGTVDLSKVKYTADATTLKNGFVIPANANVELYAVWGKDDTSYWKSIDSITITKDEILAANPDLKMHDGTTEIPAGYSQTVDFIALPGGKIGGTEETPKYFMWPVDKGFAEDGAVDSPVYEEEIFSDFAIADVPVSGGLYAVVKAWADNNGYEFNTSARYNIGAIGGAKADGTDRLSVEDPSAICNWANAALFANAMTGWYNEKHPDNQLEYAYLNEDGSVVKSVKSAQATTLYKLATMQGANPYVYDSYTREPSLTGFRLPTYAEWEYAASVNPTSFESTWQMEGGTSFPFAQSYNYISGYNGDVTSDANIKNYAVYSGLYPDDEGTQTIAKFAKSGNVRYGAKANLIGLYDMSGNIDEFVEDLSAGTGRLTIAECERYALGGSFKTTDVTLLPIGKSKIKGYGFNDTRVLRYKSDKNIGVRLVRSI